MKKRIIALALLVLLLVPALAAAASYYRVKPSSLSLRLLPDETSERLASYVQDTALTFQKKVNSKWSYVKFVGGKEGYVMTKYIARTSKYTAYVASDDTPIRVGVAYNSTEVGRLAKGAKVTVLTHGAKYDYVKSSIGYGYVLNAKLSKKKVKASGNPSVAAYVPGANYTAWIVNSSGKKVNFRTGPSTSSPVIASYPAATEVTVLSHNPKWDYVQIGSQTGYIMNQYLTTYQPAPTPESAVAPAPAEASYTAYVSTENQKGVNVRNGQGTGYTLLFSVPYGGQVTVLAHNAKWDKIQYQGKVGYVMNKYLTINAPAATPTPTPAAAAEPKPTATPFVEYTAVVTCPAGEKVNVRKNPWKESTALLRLDPGTTVKVIGPAKYKKWVQVEVNGVKGYMMKEFLN